MTFQNIKLNEALIFAKQGTQGFQLENDESVEAKTTNEVLEDLELIDDLLSIMKSKSLLNKKRGLNTVIDGRIALSVIPQSVRIGGTNHF